MVLRSSVPIYAADHRNSREKSASPASGADDAIDNLPADEKDEANEHDDV
jgi:hypothetical protein